MTKRREPRSVRAAIAVYGTLVRLLPYDARARWGDEQTACFTDLARAAHERRGAVSVAAVLLQSTWDLVLRLPREHVRNGAAGTAVSELRYAIRSLLRAPGFTAASVLTLALGLAAALSVFTLVHGVLLKPLPYSEPDRLVELDHRATRLDLDGGLGMTYGFFRFYAERMSTVEDVALYSTATLTLTGPDQAVRITGARTTPSLLHGVRLTPRMQRIEGTEFEIQADLVLLAMGFTRPVQEGMLDALGVAYDKRGNVAADTEAYRTSVDKVFSADDMRRGQSLVVWAIREGRQCARAVDAHLMGESDLPR